MISDGGPSRIDTTPRPSRSISWWRAGASTTALILLVSFAELSLWSMLGEAPVAGHEPLRPLLDIASAYRSSG